MIGVDPHSVYHLDICRISANYYYVYDPQRQSNRRGKCGAIRDKTATISESVHIWRPRCRFYKGPSDRQSPVETNQTKLLAEKLEGVL